MISHQNYIHIQQVYSLQQDCILYNIVFDSQFLCVKKQQLKNPILPSALQQESTSQDFFSDVRHPNRRNNMPVKHEHLYFVI